ncbi:hypothetical protein GJ496_003248 [Pomphorhynchus laevis]|nr:hypothetical protein GJ496_003248 [Pomphorhynchus laevis]
MYWKAYWAVYYDIIYLRERSDKRIQKLTDILVFIQRVLWKSLFGYEMDAVEKDTKDSSKYYLIESQSPATWCIPGEHALNFNAGIIEGTLNVALHNMDITCAAYKHKGTTYVISSRDIDGTTNI